MSIGWSSSSRASLNVVDSVHYIATRSNANMSWISLEIPPGISWKSPGNLFGQICRHAVAWLSVWVRCRFVYGPADTTATHYLLLQLIQIGFTFLVLPFWCQLTRVVPDSVQDGRKTVVCVRTSQFVTCRRMKSKDTETRFQALPVTGAAILYACLPDFTIDAYCEI